MKICWILFLCLFPLALGSCNSSSPNVHQSTELSPQDPLPAPTESLTKDVLVFDLTLEPTSMPSTPPVEKFVALSKQDLSSRLGVEVAKITLVKSAEQLWLNAALGCPRPGVFYPSGRVPGFQIWLDVEGVEYVYNTDFNGTLVLCPELNPHAPNADTGPTPGVPIR